MKDAIGQALGVTVEVDAKRLGELVSKQVAAQLTALFPSDTAELWAALCTQAHRERQRVAAMVDIVCPHKEACPYKLDILAGIGFADESDDEVHLEQSSTMGTTAENTPDVVNGPAGTSIRDGEDHRGSL